MKRFAVILIILAGCALVFGNRPEIVIGSASREVNLEGFLSVREKGDISDFIKVSGFIQISPREGEKITQQTEVYLNYDKDNLNIFFVCSDSQPSKIQAHITKRDKIGNDDSVGIMIDTFNDRIRSYKFEANPLGVQADAMVVEGQGEDGSFDAIWHSEGKITKNGFAIFLKIPFKSIRFSETENQSWGIIFFRRICHNSELAYWPLISTNINGILNQAAVLTGVKNISVSKNVQFIPHGAFRSFSVLGENNPADFNGGLDAKVVLKDSIVIDATVNPDFAQVESDEPQIAVNQPYELYFPEKRPFFLENASFFGTPSNLFFSRRIADPQFGLRVTGKIDKWAVGGFIMDDRAPGESLNFSDAKRAFTGVVRINRDIFKGSTIGVVYTDWNFVSEKSRVVGMDSFLKFGKKWSGSFQAVASSNSFDLGNKNGALYYANIQRLSRSLWLSFLYKDISPDFGTKLGFITRTDMRGMGNATSYRFFPSANSKLRKLTLNWSLGRYWDYKGNFVYGGYSFGANWEFKNLWYFGTSYISLYNWPSFLKKGFYERKKGLNFTKIFKPITVSGDYSFGETLNLNPVLGHEPNLARTKNGSLSILFRPTTNLEMSVSYLSASLSAENDIFENNIARIKVGCQITPKISIRTILQYEALSVNPKMTSLKSSKKFNADFLFTYQLNPYSALYIGYNSNFVGSEELRYMNNDRKQVFLKFSYLLRI